MFHVAPDEAHGRVANDAVTQHEVFQLLQVRSRSLNPHICYAVGATKAQSLQAALGGDIQQMTIGKGRDIADNEMLQLGQGPRSGAAEPGSGDFTVTQLQCRKGRGDVLVGNGAEVCLCQAQPVELGTSLPEGGQQCRGEDPPLAAGVERAPYSQRLQAVAETLPDQVPKGLGADLGAAMIEVVCNDRLGKKVRVKCNTEDSIRDLKKLIAAQTGTRWDKIVLKKWYTIFKDHVTLGDYEIHDGMNLELYYQ